MCYKITLAQSSDIAHVAPPVANLYLSELSLYGEIYGSDDMKLKPSADAGGYSVVETEGQLKIQAKNSLGALDTWQFENEAVTGLVLKVNIPEKKTYSYSHPYDWNIFWTALNDLDEHQSADISFMTNSAGPIITTTVTGVIKNNKAKLYVNYFDEVNVPSFTFNGYSIVRGQLQSKTTF